MKKRHLSIFIIFVVLFSSLGYSTTVNAHDTLPDPTSSIRQDVVEQTLSQSIDFTSNESGDFEIVEAISSQATHSSALNSTSLAIPSAKALQTTQEKGGGEFTCTTLIPYKLVGSEMINSFIYAEEIQNSAQPFATPSHSNQYVDLVVTATVSYTTFLGYMDDVYIKTGGVTAYWTTTGSKTVTSMTASYHVTAGYYSYPELLTQHPNQTLVNANMHRVSTVHQTNPTKGVSYSNSSGATPSNRAFKCDSYLEHGSSLEIGFNYAYYDAYNNRIPGSAPTQTFTIFGRLF